MTQYTHTNRKGTWNLWEETVDLASGEKATVQYFLLAGRTPRNTARAAEAVMAGHEIHEIGKSKTPVVSKKVTRNQGEKNA